MWHKNLSRRSVVVAYVDPEGRRHLGVGVHDGTRHVHGRAAQHAGACVQREGGVESRDERVSEEEGRTEEVGHGLDGAHADQGMRNEIELNG